MGEPARQRPEIEPDIRPHLRSIDGGGETTPERGDLHSVDTTAQNLGEQEKRFGVIQGGGEATPERANLASVEANTPQPRITYTPPGAPRQQRWTARFSRKQKMVGGGISGGLIALILGFAAFSPFGMLIHVKEIVSEWSDKFNSTAYHKSAKKLYKTRYFSADMCTSPIKIKCRLTPKIQGKELEALRRRGLDPELNAQGRVISMANPAKPNQRITGANFETEYANNPVFTEALDNATASPRSITWRGPQALKKMINFLRINRKAPAGTEKTEKGIVTELRTTLFTEGNAPERYAFASDTDPSGNVEAEGKAQENLDKIDDGFAEQAEKIKAEIVEKGPPPNLVVNGGINPQTAASKAISGSVEGAIKGPLGIVESFCEVRQMGIGASIAIKIYQHRALIKYAALFMTIADMAKAGDVSPELMAVIGATMTRPSTQEGSEGLTMSESALITLVTAGAMGNYASAKRFTNGNVFSRTIDRAIGFMGGGAAASTCKHALSWYGQLGTTITGIAACAVTLGGSCIAGAAKGLAFAAAIAVIIGQMGPQILQLMVGATAPDPMTDPEGSYGMGNAAASGMGALGLSAVARSNGLMPVTEEEFAIINPEASQTQRYLASVQALNHPGLMDPENPHGVSRQLVTEFGPQMLALQSRDTGVIASSFASLLGSAPQRIGNSFAGLFSPAYAAANQDKYRGDLCEDPQVEELKLATDAFCNVIYAEEDAVLDSAEFEPEKVFDFMANNKHVNSDTGEAESGDFKDYLKHCIDGDMPIVPNEDTDTICLKKRKETQYRNFRAYVRYKNILDSLDHVNNGTFGHGEASGGSTPTDADPGAVSAEGWRWPMNAPVHAGPCFGGPRGHAGMDINTTKEDNPVLAAHDGKVVRIGSGGAAGNYVTIQTTDGKIFYSYEHLKYVTTRKDALVKAGDQVGVVGLTGRIEVNPATKGHLHMVVATRNTLGSYGNLNGLLNPMTVLTAPAPGGYKCDNS